MVKNNQKFYKDKKGDFNINLIIGNGFDISILNSLEPNLTSTTFEDFFNYMVAHYKNISENIILNKMKEDKDNKIQNWSDVESSLITLFEQINTENDSDSQLSKLIEDKNQLQTNFAEFLNSRITPGLLSKIFKIANAERSDGDSLNYRTFSSFSEDLEGLQEFQFNKLTYHYNAFHWHIFNLNYTFIADNYLTMSIEIFDPHKFMYADRNFQYKLPKPISSSQTVYSDYFDMNIFHPHGNISIPASLLLGVNDIYQLNKGKSISKNDEYKGPYKEQQKLSKVFLAQDELKYKEYMASGTLFIIFGASIGETDSWWWQQILSRMQETVKKSFLYGKRDDKPGDENNEIADDIAYRPEVIIYNYVSEDVLNNKNKLSNENDRIKNKFLENLTTYVSEDEKVGLKKQIFVVSFSDNKKNTAFAAFD